MLMGFMLGQLFPISQLFPVTSPFIVWLSMLAIVISIIVETRFNKRDVSRRESKQERAQIHTVGKFS